MSSAGATPPSGRVYGVVKGFVRSASGQPVAECGLLPRPTSPIAARLKEKMLTTNSDGSYRLHLPLGTYTIGALTDSPSGGSLYGEVTDVVVTADHETLASIVVTAQLR
jgi:hypothetical protein